MTAAGTISGRRADRTAVLTSLAAVTVIAWIAAVRLAAGMSMPAAQMDMASDMPAVQVPFLLVAGMWAAMMIGMMVPSATPMVVTFTDWTRRQPASGSRAGAVTAFLSGYVLIWASFSVLAATVQLLLDRAGLLDGMGAVSRPALSGGLLVLAGVFQATPWKEACLRRCRTPMGFLVAEWREGAAGAVNMGARHGVYCLGCCWALMAVLFVVGTMNLVWMAVIAAFVLAEKVTSPVFRVRYVGAVVLLGWGALTLGTAVA